MSIRLTGMELVSRENGVRAIVSIESDGIVMQGIEVRELSRTEKRLIITYPLEQGSHKHVYKVAFCPMTIEKKREIEELITREYFNVN